MLLTTHFGRLIHTTTENGTETKEELFAALFCCPDDGSMLIVVLDARLPGLLTKLAANHSKLFKPGVTETVLEGNMCWATEGAHRKDKYEVTPLLPDERAFVRAALAL